MLNNKNRIGNFTSSEIVALTTNGRKAGTFGEKFYTYVEEKNMERYLSRCLGTELFVKPLTWGKFLEKYVFAFEMYDDMDYFNCSDKTIAHETIDYWAGSQDLIKTYSDGSKSAGDLKCPYTRKSFCKLVQPIYDGLEGMEAMNGLRDGYDLFDKEGKLIRSYKKHNDAEKYYWQIVSNAILNGTNKGELSVFMPYEDQIKEIQDFWENYDHGDKGSYYWIACATPGELPFIDRNGFYKNLNKIEFEIPQTDIDFLTERVKEAGKLLIKRPNYENKG